ncbi:ParB/RepB/Spo0J family partition protein [Achromobacter spanius]
MAKNSIDAYGASGKSNVLFFKPEDLVLVTDRKHPLFDERVFLPLNEAMVLNIKDQGVIQPISVWKDPELGQTLVVAGRQRVKHTMEANRRLQAEGAKPLLVPGVIRRGSAIKVAGAMISENEIRQADTPLGRAKKMADNLARGYGEDDLAVLFGCNIATVRSSLALLDCPAAVQNAVESGQISVTHAKALSKLPAQDQREKVAELIAAGEGAKPRERAQRQARVMGNSPRIKSRAQIQAALTSAHGEYASALRWVLGVDTDGRLA